VRGEQSRDLERQRQRQRVHSLAVKRWVVCVKRLLSCCFLEDAEAERGQKEDLRKVRIRRIEVVC
jgi:hypothetical protein